MKAYPINLRRSPDRRRHIEEELRRVGLEYERVEAVDGPDLSPADRTELVDEEAVARYPDWLTPGMIATSLSHRKAYQAIIASGEPAALVLEDDAVLGDDIPLVLDALAGHLDGAEVVLVHFLSHQGCRLSTAAAVPTPGDRRLVDPVDVSELASSAGYVVTQAACRRLADAMLPIRAAPDSWGFYYGEGMITRIRCVVPRPIDLNIEFKSTIDHLGTGRVQQIAQMVDRHKMFPVYQLLAWRRRRNQDRMSTVTLVDEPVQHSRSDAR